MNYLSTSNNKIEVNLNYLSYFCSKRFINWIHFAKMQQALSVREHSNMTKFLQA